MKKFIGEERGGLLVVVGFCVGFGNKKDPAIKERVF